MHNGSQIHPLYVLCSMYGQKFLKFQESRSSQKEKEMQFKRRCTENYTRLTDRQFKNIIPMNLVAQGIIIFDVIYLTKEN